MDTKLKKSTLYNSKLKVLAIVVIVLCTAGAFWCGQSLTGMDSSQGLTAAMYDSYFDTTAFENQYSQLVRDAVNAYLVYQSEDNVRAGNTLPEERLVQEFADSYGIEASAIVKIRESDGTKSYAIDPALLSDPSQYSEYSDILNNYFEAFYKRAVQEQLSDYKQSLKELNAYTNFTFCMINDSTGKYYGNKSGLDYIRGQKISTTIYGDYVDGTQIHSDNYYYTYNATGTSYESYYYDNYQPSIFQILRESGFTFHCAVLQPLQPGDNFYTQKQSFDANRAAAPILLGIVICCGVLIVALTIGMAVTAGREYPGGPVRLWGTDHIYNDLHLLLLVVVGVVSMGLASIIMNRSPYEGQWSNLWSGVLGAVFVADVLLVEDFILSIARQVKARQFWKNTMIVHFFNWLASLFGGKSFRGWTVFLLAAYGLINGLLGAIYINWYGERLPLLFCIIAFNLICLLMYARACRSLARIVAGTKAISEGKLDQSLELDEIGGTFQPMAQNVIGIQNGMKKAVAEAVKGERMKTDLITNVSHDLKNPLTSIVTYVDLLKKENLQNTRAQGFVQVLDEKSSRLKQLIEDLVEASKASSGNVKVARHKLNLRELVMQATGEFEDKLEGAALQLVTGETQEPVYVWADGNHLWRIAENLLSNVVKYACPNTRVYVDVCQDGDYGLFSIKNVSARQITIATDRLAERFIRGDEARTTEGSGLGLAITQSLTEIQNGHMDVQVDGDLFKISIRLPLWRDGMPL